MNEKEDLQLLFEEIDNVFDNFNSTHSIDYKVALFENLVNDLYYRLKEYSIN